MATSGSQNFTQTRDEIINDAYQLLGIYGVGRTLSAEDQSLAVRTLNKMIKAWSAKGLHLWCKEEGVLYLTPYVGQYSLGNSSTDAYVTNKSDEVITQLNGAIDTDTSSLTVDSTEDMTVGDYIGIVLTDKTIHWTTIATIPTSTTLTITTAVTGAASDDAYVYTFTDRLYKPQRILSCRRVQGLDLNSNFSDLLEIPMSGFAYQDFFNIANKASASTPIQYLYNPKNTNGLLYIYPRPTDGSVRLEFTYERLIQDLDNISDNFDLPAEWLEVITWQLAVRLGPSFGKRKKVQEILPIASQMLVDLLDWDSEVESVNLMPEIG